MEPTYQMYYTTTTTTTTDPAVTAAVASLMLLMAVVYFAVAVVMIIALWKLFTKAGKPGWASIIPIYNLFVMLEITGRPVWWLLLLLVPVLNIWIGIVIVLDFVRSYGKSMGFGVLAVFFPYVMYPILAFSKSAYVGPIARGMGGSLVPAPDPATGAQSTTPSQPVTSAPSSSLEGDDTNQPTQI